MPAITLRRSSAEKRSPMRSTTMLAALERLRNFGPLRQGEGLRQENAAKRRDVFSLHLAADAARGDELDDQAALSGMEAGVHSIGASQSAPKVGTTATDCQGFTPQPHFTSWEVQCSRDAASISRFSGQTRAASTSRGVKSERLDRRPAEQKKLAREAAMPMDEAMLAEVRQANERYAADYERRLAEEIVTMLPNSPDEA